MNRNETSQVFRLPDLVGSRSPNCIGSILLGLFVSPIVSSIVPIMLKLFVFPILYFFADLYGDEESSVRHRQLL